MNKSDLLPIEQRGIAAAVMALSKLANDQFRAKPLKEQATLKALAIAEPIAMNVLEIPISTSAPLVAYEQTSGAVVETIVSNINEQHPIPVDLTMDLVKQMWFTRYSLASGRANPELSKAVIKASTFLPAGIKELV